MNVSFKVLTQDGKDNLVRRVANWGRTGRRETCQQAVSEILFFFY